MLPWAALGPAKRPGPAHPPHAPGATQKVRITGPPTAGCHSYDCIRTLSGCDLHCQSLVFGRVMSSHCSLHKKQSPTVLRWHGGPERAKQPGLSRLCSRSGRKRSITFGLVNRETVAVIFQCYCLIGQPAWSPNCPSLICAAPPLLSNPRAATQRSQSCLPIRLGEAVCAQGQSTASVNSDVNLADLSR